MHKWRWTLNQHRRNQETQQQTKGPVEESWMQATAQTMASREEEEEEETNPKWKRRRRRRME